MNSISLRIAVDTVSSSSIPRLDTLKVRQQEGPVGFSWLRAIGFGLLLSYVVICSFVVGFTQVGPAVRVLFF